MCACVLAPVRAAAPRCACAWRRDRRSPIAARRVLTRGRRDDSGLQAMKDMSAFFKEKAKIDEAYAQQVDARARAARAARRAPHAARVLRATRYRAHAARS